MIRLTKAEAPAVLVIHGETWTQEYVDLVNGVPGIPEAARTRYKHPEIRDALRVETHTKCAYCEGRILPVAFDRIEHILPRVARPDLVVTWSNLTLACERCNNFKSDYYVPGAPLLNPYDDEPSEHLIFAGPWVAQQPGSELGYRTVQQLQLHRIDLLEARKDRLEAITPLLDRWKVETNPGVQGIIAEQIRAEARPHRPYSAAVRGYLEHAGFPSEGAAAGAIQG